MFLTIAPRMKSLSRYSIDCGIAFTVLTLILIFSPKVIKKIKSEKNGM